MGLFSNIFHARDKPKNAMLIPHFQTFVNTGVMHQNQALGTEPAGMYANLFHMEFLSGEDDSVFEKKFLPVSRCIALQVWPVHPDTREHMEMISAILNAAELMRDEPLFYELFPGFLSLRSLLIHDLIPFPEDFKIQEEHVESCIPEVRHDIHCRRQQQRFRRDAELGEQNAVDCHGSARDRRDSDRKQCRRKPGHDKPGNADLQIEDVCHRARQYAQHAQRGGFEDHGSDRKRKFQERTLHAQLFFTGLHADRKSGHGRGCRKRDQKRRHQTFQQKD